MSIVKRWAESPLSGGYPDYSLVILAKSIGPSSATSHNTSGDIQEPLMPEALKPSTEDPKSLSQDPENPRTQEPEPQDCFC